MTKQEFTNRTLVQVTDEEYAAIEVVYMASDLEKDQFCKMWCNMNKSRVQNARVERMLADRDEAFRDALYKTMTRWQLACDKHAKELGWSWSVSSEDFLSMYEIRALDHFEINIKDKAFDTMCNIRQFLYVH